MNTFIATNVQNIEISGIRKFYNKVAGEKGVVSLTLGQPDFNVPQNIKDAMIEAIQENKTAYTSNAGIEELRREISIYLKEVFNIDYGKEEICLTIGGSEGLLSTFTALINNGDKVLIPTPAYPAYESCVKLLGGTVINYNLKEDFSIDFHNLKCIIAKENPKIIVLSYPCNPTGAVLSKDDRDKLYEIIRNNKDIVVITDEIYSSLTYGEDYFSIAQFKDVIERVVLVSGFSKMFSMTGLRLGYVCAVKGLMDNIMKVHQYNVSCAPSIVQWGAYEGIRSCLEDVEYMKNEFIKRRDFVYKRLINMGFEVNLPKGAFYIFPSIKKFNMRSEEFCERALKEAKVAVVPGSAFGKGGEGYFRISYSYSLEELEEAMNRLEKWVNTL
ncbi:pyridoxal phosphate-dependent aminotransferase [Clostridium brassicae]|uniref:Aminotransferase n=1 Tax=Clostridium brassicae TaxID=2999072 RepID=A0ABT4DDI8_9CLOT|nr:aminotransferase class I/II-fold pyridoxal phosphate-dependent enzyme [Clostridium brassicae]MCY6960375.1 aminotransferase class I/II-fold pyridoxal phosphate-dependent enzyme [Clostridium brassicae]